MRVERSESDDRSRRKHGALRDEVVVLLLHSDAPMTARQISTALTEKSGTEPALTTILTVLDRLHRAGEVEKRRAGSSELLFSVTRRDASTVADDMVDAFLRSKDRTGALLSFTGALGVEDLALLRSIVGADKSGKPRS